MKKILIITLLFSFSYTIAQDYIFESQYKTEKEKLESKYIISDFIFLDGFSAKDNLLAYKLAGEKPVIKEDITITIYSGLKFYRKNVISGIIYNKKIGKNVSYKFITPPNFKIAWSRIFSYSMPMIVLCFFLLNSLRRIKDKKGEFDYMESFLVLFIIIMFLLFSWLNTNESSIKIVVLNDIIGFALGSIIYKIVNKKKQKEKIEK